MSKVKLVAPEDFPEYVRISNEAYPAMFTSMSEEQEKAWIERMKKRQAEKGDIQYYGYYRNGKLLGAMRCHTFTMNVHGVDMLTGGVGNVCVDLTHKKEHISKEMMEYYHKLYRGMGASLLLLWPFRPDFYRKMGYGYGRKYNQYRYKPDDLPRGRKEGVSFMGEDDIDAMLECYNRYVARTHGMIYKKRAFFERFIKQFKVVGYRNGDRVEGFLGLVFKKLYPDNPLMQNIEVEYMVYDNPTALSRLLSFLQTQLDQVNRVIFQTFDDDFHYVPHDPRSGSPHIFFINQESNVQGVGVMYRILDTKLFFENLADHRFNSESLRVRFNVRDSFVPENDGIITIHFKNGIPTIGEGYDVEVMLNIEYLSSLMMGVVDFHRLWTYGLVTVSDESYVEQLDRLLHCRKRPETVEEF